MRDVEARFFLEFDSDPATPTQGVDMWSVGCMLGEMVSGQGDMLINPSRTRIRRSPGCWQTHSAWEINDGSAPEGRCQREKTGESLGAVSWQVVELQGAEPVGERVGPWSIIYIHIRAYT